MERNTGLGQGPTRREDSQHPLKGPSAKEGFTQAVSNKRFANKRFSQLNDERCWHVRESQRVRGGEPEGVRKHLLSKKVFLCSKKVFRRKKGF